MIKSEFNAREMKCNVTATGHDGPTQTDMEASDVALAIELYALMAAIKSKRPDIYEAAIAMVEEDGDAEEATGEATQWLS